MLRTYLLVLPATILAALIGFLILIPLTWILNDAWPMYVVARAVVRSLVRLAGIRIEVTGPDPHNAPQPCVFVSNHASIMDPPVVFPYLPRVAPMAKASIFRFPLMGYAMRMAAFIPVERHIP